MNGFSAFLSGLLALSFCSTLFCLVGMMYNVESNISACNSWIKKMQRFAIATIIIFALKVFIWSFTPNTAPSFSCGCKSKKESSHNTEIVVPYKSEQKYSTLYNYELELNPIQD